MAFPVQSCSFAQLVDNMKQHKVTTADYGWAGSYASASPYNFPHTPMSIPQPGPFQAFFADNAVLYDPYGNSQSRRGKKPRDSWQPSLPQEQEPKSRLDDIPKTCAAIAEKQKQQLRQQQQQQQQDQQQWKSSNSNSNEKASSTATSAKKHEWNAAASWWSAENWAWQSSSNNKRSLDLPIGRWRDSSGRSTYKVELDPKDEGSCILRSTLKNGRKRTTKGLIRISHDTGDVLWGHKYYLEPVTEDYTQIRWVPFSGGIDFIWDWDGEESSEDSASDSGDDDDDYDDENWPSNVEGGQKSKKSSSLAVLPVGTWCDEDGSTYEVTLDKHVGKDCTSCTIQTTRPGGKTKTTKSLIRLSKSKTEDDYAVMWGQSYYLQPFTEDGRQIRWVSLHGKRDFIWDRVDDATSKDYDEDDVSSEDAKDGCSVDFPLGRWRDTKGSIYEVELDVNKDSQSCTIRTTRPSGRKMTTKGLLRISEGTTVMWGKSFYLKPVDGASNQIQWVSLNGGRDFSWESIDTKEAKSKQKRCK
eukprot:TRINITY_DN12456_c0_g1_i1.p1 TRINITY_DN12456_c0_g1~~TRINITY_DN12456_c0_g1_i1.p1  ORF type:complete len:599 (-),score=107.37 TRINITY_DN12456_c0_g1_i1:174-1754(-)